MNHVPLYPTTAFTWRYVPLSTSELERRKLWASQYTPWPKQAPPKGDGSWSLRPHTPSILLAPEVLSRDRCTGQRKKLKRARKHQFPVLAVVGLGNGFRLQKERFCWYKLCWRSLLMQRRLERPLWDNINAKLQLIGDFLPANRLQEERGLHQANWRHQICAPTTALGDQQYPRCIPQAARTCSGEAPVFVLAASSPSQCFIHWAPASNSSPRGFALPRIFLFPVPGSQAQFILMDFIGKALILTPAKKYLWWEKQKQRQQLLHHPWGWKEYSNTNGLNLEDWDGSTSHLGWVPIKSFQPPCQKPGAMGSQMGTSSTAWGCSRSDYFHSESSYLLSTYSWGSMIYNRHLSHCPASFVLNISLKYSTRGPQWWTNCSSTAQWATGHGLPTAAQSHPKQSFRLL